MIESVTLLGSASGRNAGDAALMHSIMDSVDEACQSRLLYEIPSLNPEYVWKNYTNRVRPVSILPWNASLKLLGYTTYKSLMRTDLSLVFDATLFDRELYNPFFNFLSSYYALLPLARKKGKKMACYTVTVGPCRTKRGKEMLKTVMDMMDFITVRDQDSVDELREAKVENPNVLITNDCALNTKPSSKERIAKIRKEIGLPETGEILALNVNPYFDSWAGLSGKKLTREVFINTYASAVTKAVKNIDATLMFVSTQHLDETLTKDIMSKINTHHKKVYFSNRVYSPQDIRGLMAQVSLLFAMRLHCLILTSAGHTPIISLNYLPKVETYLKSLDLKDYSLDFSNFSEENIAKHIEKGWQDRQQIREKLNAKIPAMKFEAFKAAILVDSLSRGFSMDEEIARLKNTKPESSLLQVNS